MNNRNVVVIEDVLTSGGAILDSLGPLREEGAVISCALVVIDRESGGRERLAAAGVSLRSLYGISGIPPASGVHPDVGKVNSE